MEKPKIETNKKGFQVIKVNVSQMLKAGGMCICDDCGGAMFNGIFIGALNRIYCDNCYSDFEERSTYYPEDKPFETTATNRFFNQINQHLNK